MQAALEGRVPCPQVRAITQGPSTPTTCTFPALVAPQARGSRHLAGGSSEPLGISGLARPSPWMPRPRPGATGRRTDSSSDTFSGPFEVGEALRRNLGRADL